MPGKIGCGVVTYNRPDYFKTCINSIPNVDVLVVVNDGNPYSNDLYPSKVSNVIQHKENKSVGISKNEIIQHLINEGCDYIFTIEDDMEMLDANVFEEYIKAGEVSGIWHMNYGPGSPFNRVQNPDLLKKDLEGRHLLDMHSAPNPRLIAEYENGVKIALYNHSVGMFTFTHRKVIEHVGLHDERFKNCWEHVSLTARITEAGLHTPFWWFADLYDSTKYMREIDGAIQNSVIAKDKTDWNKRVTEGAQLYKTIHGVYPAQTPDTSLEDVEKRLAFLKKNYSTYNKVKK